jgi:hypothetical protein
MNHPKREEWVPLLCGEADAPTARRLEAHLQECAECTREVNGWRRTMGRLDAWRLPKAERRRRTLPVQPIAWAGAAAIVLGAFVAGRFTAPGFDATNLRAELKAELSKEIQQGFARVAEDSASALANLELRIAAANDENNKELATQFVAGIEALRSQDREATETLFAKLQKQYTTDFVLLRRDLEMLASATDEEIEDARLKIYQLASLQQ